jgi:CRISPR/Cas system-associated exonuclease Cas4 (RecB family)
VERADYPADIPGTVDSDVEVSLQMAGYVYLLERNGYTVESAAYYGLENASVKYVFGGPPKGAYLSREEMDVLVARVEERLCAMPERFRQGDFRSPSPDWGCTSCWMRGVCRHRFSVGS